MSRSSPDGIHCTISPRTSTTCTRSAPTAASWRRRGRIRTAGTFADLGDSVTVKYKVYGDRVDGTYLAVDDTHAHINMPAVIMWAHGLDDRPATITFEAAGRAALARGDAAAPGTSLEFTAPNLQYLMDSPAEFGPRRFVQFIGRTAGNSASPCITPARTPSSTRYVKDVEKIVAQEGAIYGEFPAVRAGQLHVPGRLSAVRQRRRHGASQQHGDHRRRDPSTISVAGCSTPSRTSSSTAGTSSASVRKGSSRSTSIART